MAQRRAAGIQSTSGGDVKIRIGQSGLDYDRNYGISRHTGWTAVYRGAHLYPHFTWFPIALWALICAFLTRRNSL